MTRPVVVAQEVREAFLAQDALKAVVTLVAEPLSNHPEMSERVRTSWGTFTAADLAGRRSRIKYTKTQHDPRKSTPHSWV